MLKQIKNSKRGFTIIEVVLVLAIAGLIFLMVFLALPALQRSQRDTQRRNSLGEFRTQIVQYQSNNNGRLPGSRSTDNTTQLTKDWNQFVIDYLDLGLVKENTDEGDEEAKNDQFFVADDDNTDIPFIDPDGAPIYVKEACTMTSDSDSTCNGSKALNWNTNKHQIYVYMRATCDGENARYVSTANTRSVAFRYKLEGAGVYCGNN